VQAKEQGVELVGPGGLLSQSTTRVLVVALSGQPKPSQNGVASMHSIPSLVGTSELD
jgi:hypothetical protein